MITAGIDVSAKELVVVVKNTEHKKERTNKPLTFDNDVKGHRSL